MGDCDGELGGEKEGEVEEAGPGDWGRVSNSMERGQAGGVAHSWRGRWGTT